MRMNSEDKIQYLGQELLNRGFSDWFRVMFNKIENSPFIVDDIHHSLFDIFDDIVGGKESRVTINLPPRAGKTTIASYFVAYGITVNPKSNFIYTSYSQSLLGDIANRIRDILTHPIYLAMYPQQTTYEQLEDKPIDDFWLKYIQETAGKNTFSTKKITTYKGGIALFSSCGSSITGYGAGIRTAKKFSGALILDDFEKPQDIRSQVIREKTKVYFQETLLSRLNNPNVPIVNIQQRLHIDDISGFLEREYNFTTIKKPLVDANGVCQIKSQYTPERIKELQINDYVWHSQYLQEPIQLGGSLIKTDWFGYYPLQEYDYIKIVIAADTAMTVKESADYTAFIAGGVTPNGKLHIIDLVHERFEFPELKQELVKLYNKYQYTDGIRQSCNSVVIENKASGIQLIQELQSSTCLPIIPIDVTKDKLTRVEEILDYIASGNILLPVDKSYGFNPTILNECAEFNREQTQVHDDVVDALVHIINNTIANKTITLFDCLDEFQKAII